MRKYPGHHGKRESQRLLLPAVSKTGFDAVASVVGMLQAGSLLVTIRLRAFRDHACRCPGTVTFGAAHVCTAETNHDQPRSRLDDRDGRTGGEVRAGRDRHPGRQPPAYPPQAHRPRARCRAAYPRVAAPGPARQVRAGPQRWRARPRYYWGTCLAAGAPPDNHAGAGLYVISPTFRPGTRPVILGRQAARHTPPFRSFAGERAWTRSPFA